mmetsp:Transcript_23063/g.22455  ORF Transcript_23063/g.22455 Transcript_23063/m.22455 type:complete len:108 (+) Transcript_23063:151-474(+)
MLSHQQYAYSLVKQNGDNPLRMKAHRVAANQYPQARTPTQNGNIFVKADKNQFRYKMSGNEVKSPEPSLKGPQDSLYQSAGKPLDSEKRRKDSLSANYKKNITAQNK